MRRPDGWGGAGVVGLGPAASGKRELATPAAVSPVELQALLKLRLIVEHAMINQMLFLKSLQELLHEAINRERSAVGNHADMIVINDIRGIKL
jgi:hypothetical protein